MNLRILFIFLSLIINQQLFAQEKLPVTNAYLFDMEQRTDNDFFFRNPRFLTLDNNRGYNNQPSFILGELFITSRVPNGLQTDIFALDYDNWIKTRVTQTSESEYSPQIMPDGINFSVIRVEEDGSQRLWALPLDQKGTGDVLFPEVKNVGYHCWINNKTVAMFLVSKPHKLVLGDISTGTTKFVTSNIGRGLAKLPSGDLAFIYKRFDGKWSVRSMNKQNYRVNELVPTLANSEDFVCLKDGTLIMGKGSKLYKFNINRDPYWREIVDFSKYGIFNITRLAVTDGKIAIVTKS